MTERFPFWKEIMASNGIALIHGFCKCVIIDHTAQPCKPAQNELASIYILIECQMEWIIYGIGMTKYGIILERYKKTLMR